MHLLQNLLEVKRSFGNCQSKFKMHTKAVIESTPSSSGRLQPHQDELQHLSELAGIHMDIKVFRILVEFLNMGVDPNTIFSVLKSIRRSPIRQSRSAVSKTSNS